MTPDLLALKDLVPTLRANLVACQLQNAYLNPVNAAARIATGKWTFDGGAFVSPMGHVHLVPGPDKRAYFSAIVDRAMKATVAMVPAYMADHLRKQPALRVTKAEDQYLMRLEHVQALPGGELKRMRQYANKTRPLVSVTHPGPADVPVDELLDVNRVWYREAQGRFFRTSEKTQIDWLLTHWAEMTEIDPKAVLTVTRETASGRVVSFNIGTQLHDGLSVTIVERYVRDGLRAANLVGLLEHMTALGEPTINDGPSGSPEIAAIKGKLAEDRTIAFYNVERRK